MRENMNAKPDVQHFQQEIANISYNELFCFKNKSTFQISYLSTLKRIVNYNFTLLCQQNQRTQETFSVIVKCVIEWMRGIARSGMWPEQ